MGPRMNPPPFHTVYIDADIIAYRACMTEETRLRFPGMEEQSVAPGDLEDAVGFALDSIRATAQRLDCEDEDVVLVFTDRTAQNFRKAVYPPYKSKRGAKPEHLWEVIKALRERFRSIHEGVFPGLEGDDILGILMTLPRVDSPTFASMVGRVCVSIDKDLMTIPGWHYNPMANRGPTFQNPAGAVYRHMLQTLVGDTTDGYPGCPGIGPKRAERILAPLAHLDEMWDAVCRTYESRGLTQADALVQARCARILHASDYNRVTKEVILWQPPARPSAS